MLAIPRTQNPTIRQRTAPPPPLPARWQSARAAGFNPEGIKRRTNADRRDERHDRVETTQVDDEREHDGDAPGDVDDQESPAARGQGNSRIPSSPAKNARKTETA